MAAMPKIVDPKWFSFLFRDGNLGLALTANSSKTGNHGLGVGKRRIFDTLEPAAGNVTLRSEKNAPPARRGQIRAEH